MSFLKYVLLFTISRPLFRVLVVLADLKTNHDSDPLCINEANDGHVDVTITNQIKCGVTDMLEEILSVSHCWRLASHDLAYKTL